MKCIKYAQKKGGEANSLKKIALFLKCPNEKLFREIDRKSRCPAPQRSDLASPPSSVETPKTAGNINRLFSAWEWPLITQSILQAKQGQKITFVVCYYSDSEMGKIIEAIRELNESLAPESEEKKRLAITFYLVDFKSDFSNVFKHELRDKYGYMHSAHILKHLSWLLDLRDGNEKEEIEGVKEKISLSIRLYNLRGWANIFYLGGDCILCSTPMPEITVANAPMIECKSWEFRTHLLLGLKKFKAHSRDLDEREFAEIDRVDEKNGAPPIPPL